MFPQDKQYNPREERARSKKEEEFSSSFKKSNNTSVAIDDNITNILRLSQEETLRTSPPRTLSSLVMTTPHERNMLTIPKFPNSVNKPAQEQKEKDSQQQNKQKELQVLKGSSLLQPVSSLEYEHFLDQFLAPSSTKEEEEKNKDIHEKFYYTGSLFNAHGSACQERSVKISGKEEHQHCEEEEEDYDEEVAAYTRRNVLRNRTGAKTSHILAPFPRLSMPQFFKTISHNNIDQEGVVPGTSSSSTCNPSNAHARPAPFQVNQHYHHSCVLIHGRDTKRLHYFDPDELHFQGIGSSLSARTNKKSFSNSGCFLKVSPFGNDIINTSMDNNDPYLTPVF